MSWHSGPQVAIISRGGTRIILIRSFYVQTDETEQEQVLLTKDIHNTLWYVTVEAKYGEPLEIWRSLGAPCSTTATQDVLVPRSMPRMLQRRGRREGDFVPRRRVLFTSGGGHDRLALKGLSVVMHDRSIFQ